MMTQELAKKHFLEAFASKAAMPQEQLIAFDLGIGCVQIFYQICVDIFFQASESLCQPPGGAVASPCGRRGVAQQWAGATAFVAASKQGVVRETEKIH